MPPTKKPLFSPSEANAIAETSEMQVSEDSGKHSELKSFIDRCYSLKPKGLFIKELKWKYAMRTAIRGRNTMIVGDSGSGKTLTAKCVGSALNRPTEIFNLGSTQDARSSLIGNTYLKKDGTIFQPSRFVEMIQTPNSVCILDEFSRSDIEGWNILMPVLDMKQRYLRIEEAEGSPKIPVAPGVTFIATANIGAEYTATRTIDQAMLERFTLIEMDLLTAEEERQLLTYMYPTLDKNLIKSVAGIVGDTRIEMQSEAPKIKRSISTRISVEMAGLLYDGFDIPAAADLAIYPFFEKEGGEASERTFIKLIVQKHTPVSSQRTGQADPDALFGPDDMANAPV